MILLDQRVASTLITGSRHTAGQEDCSVQQLVTEAALQLLGNSNRLLLLLLFLFATLTLLLLHQPMKALLLLLAVAFSLHSSQLQSTKPVNLGRACVLCYWHQHVAENESIMKNVSQLLTTLEFRVHIAAQPWQVLQQVA